MSESIKRWVPIPTGVEVDVGTYGTDELDTEETAYLLRVGGIDARSVGQAVSSAQERAAFIVIVDHSAGREPVIGDVLWALLNSRTFNEASNPDWKVHVTDLTPEMLAHHDLVDDDTARLVALGRAVEATGQLRVRCPIMEYRLYAYGHNACLDAIYREAGVEPLDSASHRPPDSPTRPETPPDGTPVAPEPSQGDTGAVSGGAG